MADEFTHLTDSGVHMVEVGAKPDQKRRAIASGKICLDKNTIRLIQNEEIKNCICFDFINITFISAKNNINTIYNIFCGLFCS